MTTCGISFSVEETWQTHKREDEEQNTLSSIFVNQEPRGRVADVGFHTVVETLDMVGNHNGYLESESLGRKEASERQQ